MNHANILIRRYIIYVLKWLSKNASPLIAAIAACIAALNVYLTNEDWRARLFIDSRPWIRPSPTIRSLTFDGTSVSVSITVDITNVGKGPALGITLIGEALIEDALITDSRSFASDSQCKRAAAHPAGPFAIAITLFPNETRQLDETFKTDLHTKVGPLFFIGCVDYSNVVDNSHHQSNFTYRLMIPNSMKPFLLPSNGTFTAKDLMIEPEYIGAGFSAD